MSASARGFSLIELAIALTVLALALAGGTSMLAKRLELQFEARARKDLEDIRDSLIGFAASRNGPPHLPCPDRTGAPGSGVPNDGQEDREPSGSCTVTEGNLPWVTLGLGDTDPWGNRFRYRVSSAFAAASGFALTSRGDIDIRDAGGGNTFSSEIPALVLTHGRNGLGARSAAGGENPPPAGVDEMENTDTGTGDAPRPFFVSHPPIGPGGAGGEFDDQLAWITPNILFSRLIQAGRLP